MTDTGDATALIEALQSPQRLWTRAECCRALILQTITSFIVPTGDAGALSSS